MAYDPVTKLLARSLAESGHSMSAVRRELGKQGITVNPKTLDRWADEGQWMTNTRARAVMAKNPLATVTISPVQPIQRADPTRPLNPLLQKSCDNGILLQPVLNNENGGTNGINAQEVLLQQTCISEKGENGGENGDDGGEVGNPPPLSEPTPPNLPHSNNSISPEFPHDSTDSTPETLETKPLTAIPHLPHSDPPKNGVGMHKTDPLVFLDPPRTPGTPAEPRELPAEIAPGRPEPIGEAWPLVGQFQRPATIAEMLPQDFDGFRQTIRDAECLAKTEAIRAAAYRENITMTLLKLSQYAAALVETDPRLALQVMDKLAKLDSVGAKRFRLDEAGGENKQGEQMRKVSAREEDGAGVVVVVD